MDNIAITTNGNLVRLDTPTINLQNATIDNKEIEELAALKSTTTTKSPSNQGMSTSSSNITALKNQGQTIAALFKREPGLYVDILGKHFVIGKKLEPQFSTEEIQSHGDHVSTLIEKTNKNDILNNHQTDQSLIEDSHKTHLKKAS